MSHHSMPDEVLRNLHADAHAGNSTAQDRLYYHYASTLRTKAVSRLFVPANADDVVQNSLLVLFTTSPGVLSEYPSADAFIFGVLKKKILHQNRTDQIRRVCMVGNDTPTDELSSEQVAMLRERQKWAEQLAAPYGPDLAICRNKRRGYVGRLVISAHMQRDSPGETERITCRAVCELSEQRHKCIVLQHWLDLTVEEISHTLEISAASVRTHLQLARQELRARLMAKTEDLRQLPLTPP